ncbi:MAG: nucleoside triphosphate pyrophosphohydrolase, partial [Desulfuromonadales bacterium]|nr:nucleoside triphosphate pyrophosphohydrolase [Desulfuromonadales bacterium]
MKNTILPPVQQLVETMQFLRSEQGCDWDRAQTPQSLRPYILEEAYELVDAIDTGDAEDIRSELGDLLLQVVFLA